MSKIWAPKTLFGISGAGINMSGRINSRFVQQIHTGEKIVFDVKYGGLFFPKVTFLLLDVSTDGIRWNMSLHGSHIGIYYFCHKGLIVHNTRHEVHRMILFESFEVRCTSTFDEIQGSVKTNPASTITMDTCG
jgi:hypothetical protein